MSFLHNRVNRKELKLKALADNTPRRTLSFYRYLPIASPAALRDEWYGSFSAMGVLGRVYLAKEGVNAQVSVPEQNLGALKAYLDSQEGFEAMRLNAAVEEKRSSFFVLSIKVKRKIVADGIDDPTFDMARKGRYVDASTFNRLAADPDTVVLDMRNHYEYEVGHFTGAVEVPSDTFREQLPMAVEMLKDRRDRTVIMYCTGGIRCEKASAWMLHNGFTNVFHLEGGIIHYVNQVRAGSLENRFVGKNFVFDERMGERVTADVIARCHTCGNPHDSHTNCANPVCHLLFIQCVECTSRLDGCCSRECKDSLELPLDQRKPRREGRGPNVFHKAHRRTEDLSAGPVSD